jgi:hypothetical protein
VDHVGLIEPVDRFRQGVIVADAPERWLDPRFEPAFGVADRDILYTAVAVVNESSLAGRLASVQGLLQGIAHDVGSGRARNRPADHDAGEDVDDEGDINKALPGANVGDVADPQGMGPSRRDLAIDPIERTGRRLVADRRFDRPTTHHPFQVPLAHQTLHRAAGDLNALARELPPDLARTINLNVLIAAALDALHQPRIALGAGRVLARVGNVLPRAGHPSIGRSSSAWATYADALRRLSLAYRRARFSRSSTLRRSRSAVVSPSR